MNELQVHRTDDPPSVWQRICEHYNCQWLCDRAMRLGAMFRRRPQDGYDEARVLRGEMFAIDVDYKPKIRSNGSRRTAIMDSVARRHGCCLSGALSFSAT